MKTFAVYSGEIRIRVRTGDTFEDFTFKTKRAADKKILALLADGYKLDATHETMQ